jgi:predicted dienelactone hydrolase
VRFVLLAILLLSVPAQAMVCNGMVRDPARQRDIPVRLTMPEGARTPVPLVLFSHGLGGSIEKSGTMYAQAWSKAGLAVLQLQHAGSDSAVLGDGGVRGLMRAATPKQLAERVADKQFVAGLAGTRQALGNCSFASLDPQRLAATGHSFGAITVQALAGQRFPRGGADKLADPRFKAFIAFSPSPPRNDPSRAPEAFAQISRPFFSVTGSEDGSPIPPKMEPEARTAPYAAMPPGGKALVVFAGANHMAFNGGDGRGNNPRVSDATAALTTRFLSVYLLGASPSQLTPSVVQPLLGPGDRYSSK